MRDDILLKADVTILKTPVVDIELIDEQGNPLVFDLIKSRNTYHDVYIDNDEEKIIEAADVEKIVIRLSTDRLEIGKTYYVRSSVPIEFRDSDERLFTFGCTIDDKTFAITFPDPNEDLKCFPDLCKKSNPNAKMIWYDFNGEMPSGTKAVSFYLIDREKPYIEIPTAWMWNIHDHMDDYESAVELFTWMA